MSNYFIASLFLVAGALCEYESSQTPHTPHDLIEKTPLITVYYQDPLEPDNHTHGGICSGVWVGPHHILSANHCVYDERDFQDDNDQSRIIQTKLDTIRYDVPDHFKSSGYVGNLEKIVYSKECDVVVLRATGNVPLHPIAAFRSRPLQPGELVQTVGHPGDLGWAYMKGYVTISNKDFIPEENFNVINITIGHGCSGGGLFDEDNNLVGIARAIIETGDARYSYFANQDCVAEALRSAKQVEGEKRRAW